jgi:ABC-type glycerol-3-phosphate transport system substrate-binding protein
MGNRGRRAMVVVAATVALSGGMAVPAEAQTPVVTGFSPTQGAVGASVDIIGSDFTNASDVQFNGTSVSSFSITSDSAIATAVPTGAASGPISVVTPEGTTTSAATFTVVAQPGCYS